MTPDQLQAVIADMAGLGIEHVIVEQSEIDMLAEASPGALQALAGEAWFQHILIEADPYRFPAQPAQPARDFGPEVSLPNIPPGQVLPLPGLRPAVGRADNISL